MNATHTLDSIEGGVVRLPAVDLLPVTTTFDSFYRQEFPGLVAVASAMTGDTRDGEDLVQDTMVKAFLRWDRVGALQRPGGWCHFVLLNQCRSWWRRRQREARHLASRRWADAVVVGPSPETVVFWQAVRSLPVRPRAVVALHYAGELSLAEVAAVLQVPEGTVRSDLSRARSFVLRSMEAIA